MKERVRKRYGADVYSADVQFEKPVVDDRQTGRQGVNATVLFLLHCFANNFGVAMGFSFSRCQAAQTLIRLPELPLIHSAECMVRQTGRQLACTQEI